MVFSFSHLVSSFTSAEWCQFSPTTHAHQCKFSKLQNYVRLWIFNGGFLSYSFNWNPPKRVLLWLNGGFFANISDLFKQRLKRHAGFRTMASTNAMKKYSLVLWSMSHQRIRSIRVLETEWLCKFLVLMVLYAVFSFAQKILQFCNFRWIFERFCGF